MTRAPYRYAVGVRAEPGCSEQVCQGLTLQATIAEDRNRLVSLGADATIGQGPPVFQPRDWPAHIAAALRRGRNS
jgi:hypothetical protein